MGVVHGVSNLGGSLLTALAHHKQYEKGVARVTVAASYATFAAVQLLTPWLFNGRQIDLSINQTAVYLLIGMLVFMLSDEMLHNALDRAKYQRFFGAFLAVSGVKPIVKFIH